MERIIDLGCGPKKYPGAVGFDHHAYPGVDVVGDLDVSPWPFPDHSFDRVICSHIIEHVADPTAFLAEIHRIARSGATVEVTTPHFSSLASWSDPTHRWHYGAHWYRPLLTGGYLGAQTNEYVCVSTKVGFGRSVWVLAPRLIVGLLGLHRWEKHLAFAFPGGEVRTVLQVVKSPSG